MKKVRIGVMGAYRGSSMIKYCANAGNAEIVAICDKWEEGLTRQKEAYPDHNITYYNSFDEFIEHDMDAVVLANYANEHAPFAIRAMKKGLHVFSEVLPVQTMKEAVELIETVEETGKNYGLYHHSHSEILKFPMRSTKECMICGKGNCQRTAVIQLQFSRRNNNSSFLLL